MLADFVAEMTKFIEEFGRWVLYIDVQTTGSNKEAGLVLMNLEGCSIERTLRFQFVLTISQNKKFY